MKRYYILGVFTLFISCNKFEETVNSTITSAKQKVEQKAKETVQETVNEQFNKFVNAHEVRFDSVFPNTHPSLVENETGKQMKFTDGKPFFVFKYNTSDKDLLLKTLTEQATTDESRSSKTYKKIDGASIIEKLSFFEMFLPAGTVDPGFFNDLKNDKSVEYYKISRFPKNSTLIYLPKKQAVYQFVEVKK